MDLRIRYGTKARKFFHSFKLSYDTYHGTISSTMYCITNYRTYTILFQLLATQMKVKTFGKLKS